MAFILQVMENSGSLQSPSLAAPGAGLPTPELWIARLRFKWLRRSSSRADLEGRFESERARVLQLGRSVSEDDGSRQVLIRRLRGLEDSSRHWSVFMVVEHLRIVNVAVAELVSALGQGEVPSGKVSTADVKPALGIGPEVLEVFDQSCEALVNAFLPFPDLETGVRHDHPWFGRLDMAGWLALSAIHMAIHRKQIERIFEVGAF